MKSDAPGPDLALKGFENFEDVLFHVPVGSGSAAVVPHLAEVVGIPVGPVELVKVDNVGLEAFEGAGNGFLDVGGVDAGLAAADPGGAFAGDFGGEEHFVPGLAGGEPPADDALGGSIGFGGGGHGVEFGGVEEVHALFQGVVHLAEGFGFVGEGSEGHGAQAYGAHFDIGVSKLACFHDSLRYHVMRGCVMHDMREC